MVYDFRPYRDTGIHGNQTSFRRDASGFDLHPGGAAVGRKHRCVATWSFPKEPVLMVTNKLNYLQ